MTTRAVRTAATALLLTTAALGLGPATAHAGALDGGLTGNPNLNYLLGATAGLAQQPLLPGVPTPPGVDLNTWALQVSSQIGVNNVYNGTSPIYSNGAIAGMHNSLGIAFPAPGGTLPWALSLLDDDNGGLAPGSTWNFTGYPTYSYYDDWRW